MFAIKCDIFTTIARSSRLSVNIRDEPFGAIPAEVCRVFFVGGRLLIA